MEKKVKDTIKTYHMISPKDTVILGLSGGADSCALFHILLSLAEEMPFTIKAVHINHGLRDKEAKRDELFVKALCERHQIELFTFCHDIKKEAEKRKVSEEEAGRIIRYERFRQVAAFYADSKIAVAHHKNDQAETFFLRLFRGAGLKGLCAMKPVFRQIIRPLLFCSRKEIETYCEKNQISFCEDSTNKNTVYARNKVRHMLLPFIEKNFAPQITDTILKTVCLLQEEEDYLEKRTEEIFLTLSQKDGERILLSVEALKKEHIALKRRLLRRAYEKAAGKKKDLSFKHTTLLLEIMEKGENASVSLPHGIQGVLEYQNLVFQKEKKEAETKMDYSLEEGTSIYIKEIEKYVYFGFFPMKNESFCRKLYTKAFDYDKIKNECLGQNREGFRLRNRLEGDRIYFSGIGGHKKIKDYFIDEKIPKAKRDHIPLFAVGGEILWIMGGRVSQRYIADEKTVNYVYLEVWEDVSYEGKSGNINFKVSH